MVERDPEHVRIVLLYDKKITQDEIDRLEKRLREHLTKLGIKTGEVKPVDANEIPRRCRTDKHTPAEKAITQAMYAVEDMPADVLLTEAVVLLQQAKDKVADYVDREIAKKATP